VARRLHSAGASVGLVSRRTSQATPSAPSRPRSSPRDRIAVGSAADAVVEGFGRLDAVVANAGVGAYARSDAAIPSSTFSYDYQVAQRAALRG